MMSPDEAQRENIPLGVYLKRAAEERRGAYVAALLEERATHADDAARLEAIDRELARVGYEATPAKGAT